MIKKRISQNIHNIINLVYINLFKFCIQNTLPENFHIGIQFVHLETQNLNPIYLRLWKFSESISNAYYY